MLPNLSQTIFRLSQPIKLIKIVETIVNHRPVETETTTDIRAVIQPADKEKINKDGLDYSLEYIQVHSLDGIQINDIIEYKGKRYRAYENSNYSDYGYYENIMEEIK